MLSRVCHFFDVKYRLTNPEKAKMAAVGAKIRPLVLVQLFSTFVFQVDSSVVKFRNLYNVFSVDKTPFFGPVCSRPARCQRVR